MLRHFPILLFFSLLLGCTTPAEHAARVQEEVEGMIKLYGPACESLGYTKDSDPWRDCILHLSARDDYRYRPYPATTTCIGHRGFYNCTTY